MINGSYLINKQCNTDCLFIRYYMIFLNFIHFIVLFSSKIRIRFLVNFNLNPSILLQIYVKFCAQHYPPVNKC